MDLERLKNALTAIPYGSKEYPVEWAGLPDAPQTAYAYGNVRLLKARKFTVVGSRRTPAAALKLGERIAEELSSQFVVVTGAAEGGDAAALTGALKGKGGICVLAGGFSALPQTELSLLRKVAKYGLILSPHPFETPVRAFSYDYRNKLLAALGEGTLVLGAAEKSGALITAKYAEKMQKPLFALPYPPNTETGAGCNALIKRGAKLTENASDIAAAFGLVLSAEKPRAALTADEQKLFEALRECSEGHLNELSERSGIPVFKARALLSALEVKGFAVSLGGNRYGLT